MRVGAGPEPTAPGATVDRPPSYTQGTRLTLSTRRCRSSVLMCSSETLRSTAPRIAFSFTSRCSFTRCDAPRRASRVSCCRGARSHRAMALNARAVRLCRRPVQCLKRLERCPTRADGSKALLTLATGAHLVPGDAGWPLGTLVPQPKAAADAGTWGRPVTCASLRAQPTPPPPPPRGRLQRRSATTCASCARRSCHGCSIACSRDQTAAPTSTGSRSRGASS